MKRSLQLGTATLAMTVAGLCQADALGMRISAYSWQQEADGNVRSDGSRVDLNNELDIDDERNQTIEFALEHPIPLLPNLRLAHTEMELSGDNVLSSTIQFDGNTYTAGTAVSSDLDLTHTDATLYYELLDNWISLDAGLTVRYFSGDVELRGAGVKSSESFVSTLPMVYLAARADLPLSGLYVAASGNAIGYSDARLFDYRVNLGYETDIGLGAEVGLRRFDLDFDDDDDEADLTVDGIYAGLFFHF